jgi:predicted metal-dependent phosphoesterase TrpH
MKIDLHVHASERSGCSRSGEEEMIRAAIGFGLDGLAFTDHQLLVPPDRLAELNKIHAPFRIFSGIEIHTIEEEDILAIGVSDPDLGGRNWLYAELYDFVRARDGFLALAHPFRFHDTIRVDVESRRPDAIEVASTNIDPMTEPRIRAAIEHLKSTPLHASDAHQADRVGMFYVDVQGAPQTDRELVALLKKGAYSCELMPDRVTQLRAGRAGPAEAEG